MVQVRMRQEHPVDAPQFVDFEVSDPGAGIEQHVFVQHERSRAQTAADTATATEYAQLHPGHPSYLVGNTNTPSQSTGGGAAR